MNPFKLAAIVVLALIGGFLGFGSWFTIDQGERGVLLRNGAVVKTLQPGLGWKAPWIESVAEISVKTVTWSWPDMEAYSFDQQPAHMKVSLTLNANPDQVEKLYAQFGSLDAAIRQGISPHIAQQVKIVFGQYTAVRAVQDRARLNADIKKAIGDSLSSNALITVQSVQLEDIKFSAAYMSSIEQRMLAEVDVQKIQQNAEREKVQAQITVTKALATANAVREEAKAAAEATTLRGNAEADAIRARGAALRENKGLVELQAVEKWDGKLPTSMIPGSAMPFIGVK